jgi:membrane protein YdbS with pleckstrin-like domain
MGYVEQNLMVGEKVTYRTKLHWVIFLWSVIFVIIAIVGFANGSHAIGVAIGVFFIFLAALTGIWSYIEYSTWEFAVTNKRVLVKIGWIRRHSLELLLTKVEGIGVNQGILGRILGYGTIVVTGTGGTKEPFHKIDAPLEFRKRVQEQIAAGQEST